METIYQDIATRTGGNIYIGVVGPVRTGKSTLIKAIMEQLVIPAIADPYRRDRARDELPQSGSGKTIMTSEPKFIPEEAVEICPDGTAKLRVRLIDSVGYLVPGATGAQEDGAPRMISTPWFDHPVPMTEAAELGTRKVIREHCSIGIVVTTDGSITDIPRQDYVEAEHRAISDMAATGKPFLVVVNSRHPDSPEAQAVRQEIYQTFSIPSVIADCQALDAEGIRLLLQDLLYAFPLGTLAVHLPRWMDALEDTHPVKATLYQALLEKGETITTLAQAQEMLSPLSQLEGVSDLTVGPVDLGTGTVTCRFRFPDSLFYSILSSRTGQTIHNDGQLLALLTELAGVKQDYDQIRDALAAARATGYGIVMPSAREMTLETPEIIHKGSSFGVKLKAGAPSIHMIRVDIATELSPLVGDEKQSRELIDYLTGQEPENLWQSNIFGKSVHDMIQDGLNAKVMTLAPEVRDRFRASLGRIVNDGASGLICLIL